MPLCSHVILYVQCRFFVSCLWLIKSVLVLINSVLFLWSLGQDLSAEQRIHLLMFLVSSSKCELFLTIGIHFPNIFSENFALHQNKMSNLFSSATA